MHSIDCGLASQFYFLQALLRVWMLSQKYMFSYERVLRAEYLAVLNSEPTCL